MPEIVLRTQNTRVARTIYRYSYDSACVESSMEIQSILVNTYNADHNLRLEAEAGLSQLLRREGALLQLLGFVGNRDFHRDLRQAASIVVKNRIREFWWVHFYIISTRSSHRCSD